MMFSYLVLLTLFVIYEHRVFSIPACIIIDTNMIQKSENELTSPDNRSSSSSLLLRNLRMLDHQRSNSAFLVEPIPFVSYRY